jgi:HAD superfamily hydrolase (TIGR01490 family)
MHRLAIYDMDKTITSRPTWTPFLRAWARAHPARWAGLAATAGPVALYLARRIDRARLKEMTQALVMGRSSDRVAASRVANAFAATITGAHVFDDARARIAADRADGYRIVLATASYDFYVRPIAAALGIDDVIATPSIVDGDRMVARIAGENCYGDAKLRMIEAWMAAQGIARDDAHVRFYSDHVSDAPTLAWSDEPFAVNPHARLRALAQDRGWPVLHWR